MHLLSNSYRRDIEGLRGIAVSAVIAFHFGWLQSGYLGVDIFFVISGYLITGLLVKGIPASRGKIFQFYARRIRRIIPLLLFVNVAVLVIGFIVMLPDDLENVGQSVFATNFLSNNFLQILTTKNYWDISSDYKPMLHTWSLGIEEQFYLLYPLIFWLIRNTRKFLIILVALTAISLFLFLNTGNDVFKFYLIPYRFFELSFGGLAALLMQKKQFNSHPLVILLSSCTIMAILVWGYLLPTDISLIVIVVSTLAVIIAEAENQRNMLLGNGLLAGIGKISFSLYMWHQPILVFGRYLYGEKSIALHPFAVTALIFAVSILSYALIERPFRNKKIVRKRLFLGTMLPLFFVTSGLALFIAVRSGIVRDVPELDITMEHVERNAHAKYNDRVLAFNNPFDSSHTIKVLVVGNSQARDWANVLLESSIKNKLQLSYVEHSNLCADFSDRCHSADYIFISTVDTASFKARFVQYRIDQTKIKIIGVKSFGKSNGVFYNQRNQKGYCKQEVEIPGKMLTTNSLLKMQWGEKYIDLLSLLSAKNEYTVPVFTPDCKFISQDCIHLTKNGAVFIAKLFDQQFKELFYIAEKERDR